jgi:hypothetical protein
MMSISSSHAQLTLPSEWDDDNEMMPEDEELSATSHEEASKVFELWQTDEQEHELDIMEVDEQMGSDLLGDDIFHDPCMSPTGPLEELVFMSLDEEDIGRFSLTLLSDEASDTTSSLPFEERYKVTLEKLAESMKRSQETRKSLTMKTPKTEEYPRVTSVSGVLTSIEKSTQELLKVHLKNMQRI